MPLSDKGSFSDPEIIDLDAITFAVIRKVVATEDIPTFYGEAFSEVFEEVSRQSVAFAGPPAGITFSPPHEVIELGAAIPYRGPFQDSETVKSVTVPAGRAVRVTVVGSYEATPQAYVLIRDFIEAHGLTPRDFPWETYIDDPLDTPEDALTTEVVWPINN